MTLPAPKFKHFERVMIAGDASRCRDLPGESGTIVCLDSSAVRIDPAAADKWLYVVWLPQQTAYRSFFQSDLRSAGGFDLPSDHLGQQAEISFDTQIEPDNDWAEATFRLPGEFWQVAIFQQDDVRQVDLQYDRWPAATPWEQDAAGIVIRFPRGAKMDRDALLQAMSQAYDVDAWVEVAGPDSMMLR